MNQKTEMECNKWIAIVKFPDIESHTENVTSFGPFDTKNNALSWAFQVYEEEYVSIEVIPVNEPFDPEAFKKFDPNNPMIMTDTGNKKTTLSVVPPNDEKFFGELDDEHQPTEQDEWLDYDPDC